MIERNTPESALNERQGVDKLPTVNPYMSSALHARKAQKPMDTEEYVKGIREGNRTVLSRAITLIESTLPEHQRQAQEIIERCLPYSGNSFRLGITGVPGAGKSTFINTLGLHLARTGKKLAVLAIDPSSERTKGSILGDKTRMDELACQENVFIRPSPSAGSLGGVARKTRESVILCEAAGFTHIIIETVGVGQSETEAYNMVDYFLLLQLANLGDELQGIKRGIMEMADGIAINKAEGDFRPKALLAQTQLRNALQLFPPTASGWKPSVEICSAKTNDGVTEVWSVIEEFERFCKQNGSFELRRREQLKKVLQNSLQENILAHFFAQPDTEAKLNEAREQVYDYKVNPYTAAQRLAEDYFNALGKPSDGPEVAPIAPPSPKPAPKSAPKPVRTDIPHFEHALAVDAACAGNPGKMEYQGVQVNNGKVIFHAGPFPEATNNIGEFLAIVHALSFLNKHGLAQTPVYSDSVTGMAWVRKKKANTKITPSARNRELLDMVARAEHWLQTNRYQNPILKWQTEKWGEIPADFGRK